MGIVRFIIFGVVGVLCGLTLHGCEFNVPKHLIGNWEAQPNYLEAFGFTPPGNGKAAMLNSCSDAAMAGGLQCSGHGRCKDYFTAAASKQRVAFCECDLYWADPECRTPRKSQVTAYILSMFLGMFGVDQFYLGYMWYGIFKLITLGGAGVWYLYDLCRIGSSTVLTHSNFRVAADLPHFAFVLSVVTAMLLVGFLISIWNIQNHRFKKAHELMMIRIEAEDESKVEEEPVQMLPPPMPATTPLKTSGRFSGYGATLPMSGSEVPRTLPPSTSEVPFTLPTSGRLLTDQSRIIQASAVPTEYSPPAGSVLLPSAQAVNSRPISSAILPTSSVIMNSRAV